MKVTRIEMDETAGWWSARILTIDNVPWQIAWHTVTVECMAHGAGRAYCKAVWMAKKHWWRLRLDWFLHHTPPHPAASMYQPPARPARATPRERRARVGPRDQHDYRREQTDVRHER
jgi:hypothetical protein